MRPGDHDLRRRPGAGAGRGGRRPPGAATSMPGTPGPGVTGSRPPVGGRAGASGAERLVVGLSRPAGRSLRIVTRLPYVRFWPQSYVRTPW